MGIPPLIECDLNINIVRVNRLGTAAFFAGSKTPFQPFEHLSTLFIPNDP